MKIHKVTAAQFEEMCFEWSFYSQQFHSDTRHVLMKGTFDMLKSAAAVYERHKKEEINTSTLVLP